MGAQHCSQRAHHAWATTRRGQQSKLRFDECQRLERAICVRIRHTAREQRQQHKRLVGDQRLEYVGEQPHGSLTPSDAS